MNSQKLKSFWSRQIREIKNGGWAIILRKAKVLFNKFINLPFFMIGYTFAVPVVLFIRMISSWKLIRFGYLYADRLGHFAFDVDYYLIEKKMGLHENSPIDIFFYRWSKGEASNSFFSIIAKRNLLIFGWVKYLFHMNAFLPGGEKNQYLPAIERFGSRDILGLRRQVESQLSFSEEEHATGREFLNSIGVNKSEKIVCLMVRDSAYLAKDPLHNKINWDYHNYRDSDIDTYEDAALALAEKGYWIFRMGKIVNKPFKVRHPRIFDYANSNQKSDFLDIWILANCSFGISTGLGIDYVADVFRKPIAYVNAMTLGEILPMPNPNSIWVPKNLIWIKNGRKLSLKEQIESGAICFQRTEEYANAGIDLIDNSPDDITKTVLELELKITGDWESQTQDEVLQGRFWEILQTWKMFSKLHGKIPSKMSDTFLRENHEWFLN